MSGSKARWEQVYQDKHPAEVSWHQRRPSCSLALIDHAQVGHDAAIIDVGGGHSTLVDYLHQQRYYNLSVLDISATSLELAQQRLGEIQHLITWIESDITTFLPSQKYALWHDRAVFHFLTNRDDQRRYVHALKSALRAGGTFIIATFAVGGPEQCSGLEIVQYDTEKLKSVLGEEFELLEQKDETHLTPANREQAFTYFRFKYAE